MCVLAVVSWCVAPVLSGRGRFLLQMAAIGHTLYVLGGIGLRQQIMDELLAFWGIVDDQIDVEQIRNIIKAGKRIERVDLYARLELDKKRLEREIHRMIPRVLRSGMRYDESALSKVSTLINENTLDYYGIISSLERIVA